MKATNIDPVLMKFRRKFVVVSMSFVLALLLALMLIAGYMTASQRLDDVNFALDLQSNRMANMPAEIMLNDMQVLREWGFDSDVNLDKDAGPSFGRDRKERDAGDDPLVATSAYLMDTEGAIQVTVSNALSLDAATVEEATDDILAELERSDKSSMRGNIRPLNLYYEIEELSNGYSVALASGNYVRHALYSLWSTLGFIELTAFFLFLALSIFLSRWVVGPVERAWAQQRRFIADASHELKTPLSVIRANDSLLMANPSASVASQMQWIESTETEATLMQDLINDMLFLAQSENTNSETIQVPVDFSHVVQAAELQFESVAFERGVKLDAQIAPNVQVVGDEKALNRLVGTLIDNACKYAQDGGRVSLQLSRSGAHCSLSVNNTGEYIAEADLPHVFDRFYRSDKARTREQGGFGLGLSIAKSIVEKHKGTIAVSSNAQEGTTFTVVFPLA